MKQMPEVKLDHLFQANGRPEVNIKEYVESHQLLKGVVLDELSEASVDRYDRYGHLQVDMLGFLRPWSPNYRQEFAE